jgi:hypothetical protein
MTERTEAKRRQQQPAGIPPSSDLDSRYGAIGLPAVAAAACYASDAKNDVYAPAAPLSVHWPEDTAA